MNNIVNDFVKRACAESLKIEGIAVADEKRVLFEHHFTPDQARNIHSHTKSYMSTAAGIAISRGKLRLSDRLADFFPEALPENPQPELFEITLRHLLTMSSGFNRRYLMNADRRRGIGMPDYLRYMLGQKIEVKPGSRFAYSTADSILAGRMIEKAVGERLQAFVYHALFKPMGQGCPIWETDPQGCAIGGAGLFMRLTDMMKLGQLYLADGVYNNARLVEPAWIHEASAKQIDTDGGKQDIWNCGYGYQFWLSPYPGAYRADGAYGQITTVLPKSGLVVAVQCPEQGDFPAVKQALHEQVLSLL